MNLISPPGVTPPRPIELRTKKNLPVDNDQPLALSQFVKKQAAGLESRYSNVKRRHINDPSYNCHGLVFASRRTWILEPSAVAQVIEEDGYVEVTNRLQVLPGDIIVFYQDGLAEHSGIVLTAPTMEKPALILGKWAGWDEVIHETTVGPYATFQQRFYRMP